MRRKKPDIILPLPQTGIGVTATAAAESAAEEAGGVAAPAPTNGDGSLNANDEFLDRLRAIHDRKLARKIEVDADQEELKRAKAALQSVQDEEDKLLAAYLYSTMPLYDPKPAVNGQAGPVADAWRAVPIREALAGLPSSLYERLEEAEITTMGTYADYCERNAGKVDSGEHPTRKIKGIGPSKVEQIQAAEEAFWKRWKEAPAMPRCRMCGCTEEDCSACFERTGEPCHWVEADLCSACQDRDEGDEDSDGLDEYDYTADGQS